ncbi:MAG: helix-turn-helix transcriptional regulator [Catenulispora sp.]|nr:helix-turn-helix transcriptional regulator [Catenulispora sp.]
MARRTGRSIEDSCGPRSSEAARSVRSVQTSVTLATRPEFSVHEVTCLGGHADWSPSEEHRGHRLVLVRRGRFRRSADGTEAELDRTTAYLSAPGQEERFAHPAGGDLCTSIGFSSVLWGRLPIGTAVYIDARIELAHRRLLLAATTGDADYATAEELLNLVALAAGFSTRSLATDDALAAAAREAVIADVPEAVSLCSLAELLGVSPFRLSRVFSRRTGVSLTRYRNRVRVGRAMDRLAGGETALAELAADLGFSDQAHLTRTVREHVGHTPVELRRLLTAA